MKVSDVMRSDVITVTEDATYEDVARLLYDSNVTGAPVLDKKGKLIGVISEKDLFRVLYPYYSSYYRHPEKYTDFEHREQKIEEIKRNPITKFMTTEIVSVDHETPVMKVGGIMLAKGIHVLPVVNTKGSLVGTVDRIAIYQNILKMHLGLFENTS